MDSRRRALAAALAGVAALAAGGSACTSGDGPAVGLCADARTSPIYNGQATPAGLDVAVAQQMAIGALEDADGWVVCSGTMIAKGWVLSARHCTVAGGFWFRTGPAGQGERARAVARWDHPDGDVSLFQVAFPGTTTPTAIVPIPPWPDLLDATWIGRELVLAGLGATEDGARGELLYVREPVVALAPSLITVDGRQQTGACGGDSGGPALAVDASGALRVVGTLSRGDSSCLGQDVYERIDVKRDWLTTLMETECLQ